MHRDQRTLDAAAAAYGFRVKARLEGTFLLVHPNGAEVRMSRGVAHDQRRLRGLCRDLAALAKPALPARA